MGVKHPVYMNEKKKPEGVQKLSEFKRCIN